MRGRPPILETEDEVLHHFIGEYYKELEQNPSIRLDPEKHVELIEEVNVRYFKTLTRGAVFNDELYKERFLECIEFLTRAFEKKRKLEDENEAKRKFRESIMK